jgi:2-polyprenyl-3-methyl-5-hydroxy-6-metoxy-1,4-benzoquinol methylase
MLLPGYTSGMGTLRLTQRRVVAELMDAPNLDPAAHRSALAGLARINRISGAVGKIAGAVWRMAQREKLSHVSLLDIACGGGDVPVGVAAALRRRGVTVNLVLMDKSQTALTQASARAKSANLTCETFCGDVRDGLPKIQIDVVTNSLFLHHLSEDEVVAALMKMKQQARRMVVISDLRRTKFGWLAAWIGCHALSRSAMVHHDGPASVEAAWTPAELAAMAHRAGMESIALRNCWPWRMLLAWERRHA